MTFFAISSNVLATNIVEVTQNYGTFVYDKEIKHIRHWSYFRGKKSKGKDRVALPEGTEITITNFNPVKKNSKEYVPFSLLPSSEVGYIEYTRFGYTDSGKFYSQKDKKELPEIMWINVRSTNLLIVNNEIFTVSSLASYIDNLYKKAESDNSRGAYLDLVRTLEVLKDGMKSGSSSSIKIAKKTTDKTIGQATDRANEIYTANSEAAYRNAENINTIKAYTNFLKNYHSSPLVTKAKANIYSLEYNAASTVNELSSYIEKFPESPYIVSAINDIYIKIANENNLKQYYWFINRYPHTKEMNLAISKSYSLIRDKSSIAAYTWFMTNYPKSEESRKAIDSIHRLAFQQAREINSIDAYNDYIVAYPASKQREQAEHLAYELEEDKYSSYITSDEKLARALSIKAKQIKRKASETGNKNYLLVVKRMTRLLEDKFPTEHSTERHLENEAILSALRDVGSQLSQIKRVVNRISDNTSDISSIIREQSLMMDNHFKNFADDRDMQAKYTKDHRHWERYLKGQNL